MPTIGFIARLIVSQVGVNPRAIALAQLAEQLQKMEMNVPRRLGQASTSILKVVPSAKPLNSETLKEHTK